MKYQLEVTWNGKPVITATCTAVMAWEILRVMASQYGNAEKAGFEVPALIDIYNAFPGTVWRGEGDDGSGKVTYVLERSA